ncbi:MAG TPA: AAA family ATPase [Negativicutes bacterium]|jgi:general secretion pathway protein A
MYLHFYNLKREPFNITPDPELLFMSPSHKEALAAVICGVNRRKGFVAIIGEVGLGKTTIIRSFLERISHSAKTDNQGVKTIYIFNANISFKALLKTIYQNLGQISNSDDIYTMIDQLHLLLIDEYKAGNNVVLIIDEAQNMPVSTLENLRMLSNLETSSDKLIQVVLCGQPEFELKLNLHELRQLKQRIAIRVRILPLSKNESLEYINHRLSRSVTKDPDIFTQGALNRIVKEACGIPRNINILCDNCLVTAFGNQQKKVTSKVAKEIIADHRMERSNYKWLKLAALFASIIIFIYALWTFGTNDLSSFSYKSSQKTIEAPRKVEAQATKSSEVTKEVSFEEKPITINNSESDKSSKHKPKLIKKGDTLAGLIRDNYGSVDHNLFKLIIKSNPHISNVNKIQEGDKIYFPLKDQIVAEGEVSLPRNKTGE